MNTKTSIQEKKRVPLLKMESIVVPAAVIITLKGNETFDWVKLSNMMLSFNSIDALKARFLDIRSIVSKLTTSAEYKFSKSKSSDI